MSDLDQLPCTPTADLGVSNGASCMVFSPNGELDAFTVAAVREQLATIVVSEAFVIDLSAVRFIDAVGLGALIGGIRRARAAGGDVAVVCPGPALRRLFAETGFDRFVRVTTTMDEAADALGLSNPDRVTPEPSVVPAPGRSG